MISRLLPVRIAASLFAAGLVFVATSRYGPGVTPDSAQYIAAARSLLSGGTLLQYDGSPYVIWPPLYPALLAATTLVTGLDPQAAARLFGGLVSALLVHFGSGWFERRVRSRSLAILGTALLAVFPPLVAVSAFAWSESLFCLMVVLFLLAIESPLSNMKLAAILPAAMAAGAASLTRYVGTALIPVGAALLLLAGTRSERKLRAAALFAGLAATPAILWLLRNLIVTSRLTGERAASTRGLRFNTESALTTIASWMLPLEELPRRPALLAAAGLAVLVAGAVLIVLVRPGAPPPPSDTSYGGHAGPLKPALAFTAFYIPGLIATAAVVDMDVIGDRLLSPIAVPLVWIVVYTLDRLRLPVRQAGPARAGLAAVLILAAWTGWSAVGSARFIERAVKLGAGGYAIQSWQESELVGRLRREPIAGTIYSNIPAGLYLSTGLSCRWTPVNAAYTGPDRDRYDWNRFTRDRAAGGEAWIVWFGGMEKPYLVPLADIARAVRLEPAIETRDGSVYRLVR